MSRDAEDDPTSDASEGATQATPPSARSNRPALRSSFTVERYAIGDVLGHGGMGEVVAAEDRELSRSVAIKRLRSPNPSDDQIERFVREARIQGGLEHPAIVPVHELGLDREGHPYFAMKRLKGTTLSDILGSIRRGEPGAADRFPLRRLLRAFVDVCMAVEFAHDRGVIHRDIKPGNVMLGDFGEVYMLDWGVALTVTDAARVEGDPDLGDRAAVLGTPGYMAPEQLLRTGNLDGRVDVYSLGCVLFEILAGQSLHPKGKPANRSTLAGIDARPSLRAPDRDIPPELDALCLAATQVDRDDRISRARELGEHVQRFLDGDRDLARRREIARDQVAAAVTALETDHEDGKRTAIRAAGRALALDPTSTAAADIVGRLMLEPPSTVPPEVDAAIAQEDRVTRQRYLGLAVPGYLGYLAFIPAMLWIGVQEPAYIVALLAVVVVSISTLAWNSLRATPTTAGLLIGDVIHGVVIALFARMFSPLLIAPGVAAVTAMAMLTHPSYARPRMIAFVIGLTSLAVLLPWVAEHAGLLSTTVSFEAGALVIHAPSVVIDPIPVEISLAVFVVGLITAAVGISARVNRDVRRARRQLHVQAWRLRQLAPDAIAWRG